MPDTSLWQGAPPLSTRLAGYHFPEYSATTAGGVRLCMLADRTQPLINLKILFHSGSSDYAKPGLAYFASQMLTRGTRSRTGPEISDLTDSLGAHFNASAGSDETLISFVSLMEYLPQAIDIASDCIYNPVFSNEETDRLKKKHISSIEQDSADPNYLCEVAFNAAINKNNRYRWPVGGTLDSIRNISSEDCLGWHNSLISGYSPVIILTGCFDPVDAASMIESKFKPAAGSGKNDSQIKYESSPSVAIIEKAAAAQTTLKTGRMTLDRRHPDYPLLQLANVIFGGYFHSRLNMLLREKLGYTYGVHSGIENRDPFSILTVSTNVSPEATRHSVESIIEIMNGIATGPVPGDELERARQYTLGSFLRSCESIQGISQLLRIIELFGLPAGYFNTYFERISSATSDELLEVQRECFKPDNLTIAAAGAIDTLVPALQPFGVATLYDKNGETLPG